MSKKSCNFAAFLDKGVYYTLFGNMILDQILTYKLFINLVTASAAAHVCMYVCMYVCGARRAHKR